MSTHIIVYVNTHYFILRYFILYDNISFKFLCVVLVCVFTFWVPCCNVRYDFYIKKNDARFVHYLQLFVGELMSYLRYLCLFVYSGVQHILCCVFVLSVSSCVPYVASFSVLSMLIVPSVFSNVYILFYGVQRWGGFV
jgi:hypothetical protein